MSNKSKSLKQELKNYFQYKNFEFDKTDGIACALLSSFMCLTTEHLAYWFITYPFWFFAYHGNRFFIIAMSLIFAILSAYTLFTSIDINILQITFWLLATCCFYRDMCFLYRYKTEHKAELYQKYNLVFMLKGFAKTAILAWLIFYTCTHTLFIDSLKEK